MEGSTEWVSVWLVWSSVLWGRNIVTQRGDALEDSISKPLNSPLFLSRYSEQTLIVLVGVSSYCPWVWNDIGVDNHRQFLIFVSSLVIGILLFARLSAGCKPLSSLSLSLSTLVSSLITSVLDKTSHSHPLYLPKRLVHSRDRSVLLQITIHSHYQSRSGLSYNWVGHSFYWEFRCGRFVNKWLL